MKHNCSLKDLHLNRLKINEDKPLIYPINFITFQSIPRSPFNIQNIDSQLGGQGTAPHRDQVKQIQKSLSHKSVATPSIIFQIKSPKEANFPKADKAKGDKNTKCENQNAIHAFQQSKPAVLDRALNILRPVEKNLCLVEQPKKHKILRSRQRQVPFREQFEIGRRLGKGRFGNVYSALHKSTNFLVAVKQISLEKVNKKLIQRLIWEIKIQSFLKHQHCLQLYKCFREGDSLYLLLEQGDGSLFDRLRQKKYFTEAETCYYLTQTMKALLHMHHHGIIHRDLKPENIVLINNVVKLADFGWSVVVDKNSKRNTFCGTLDYVSPEIVLGNQYDEMVDVWSVGVLCYELCTGHAPFASKIGRDETYRKILNVDLKFPRYLSEDIKDFMSRLLTRDPQHRMNLQEAMRHRWIVKYSSK